jgi:hypothetical protein
MARWLQRLVAAVALGMAGLLLVTPVAWAHGAAPDMDDIAPPLALGIGVFLLSFLTMLWAPADLLGLPAESAEREGER